MYDELIKNLRLCSECDFGQHCNECTQESTNKFCCDELLHQVADVIEELTDRNVGKWIPVTERLPDPGVFVLVTTRQKTGASVVRIGLFSGTNYGWSCGGASKNVVAWMPLPEPYEGS